MTRHGKNATSNPVYTSAEKRKDCVEGKYGSLRFRIGADSVKAFDACSLTNQRCTHPVVTPHGFLYEKEAILENILHQKRLIARRLQIYDETVLKAKQAEKRKGDEDEHANTVGKFLKRNCGTAVASSINSNTGLPNNTITARSIGGAPKLEIVPGQPVKSFWIPAQTPDSTDSSYCDAINAAKIVQKPDETIRCPMSGNPLKLRDLIDVKFTTVIKTDEAAERRAERGTANSQPLYKCPVTHDLLNNATQCVVLRPSGLLIKHDAVEKILKLDGMRDPVTGIELKPSDIIPLQRGGTGFTAAVKDSKQLIPAVKRPAMPSA